MFQNQEQNHIKQNNLEHNNGHKNTPWSNRSHSKTRHHHPLCSHHNNAYPTRLIFSAQRNTTPCSRPTSTFSFTNTPYPTTAFAQKLTFPGKQADIKAAVSEGLSERQAQWQAKKFRDYWQVKSGKEALKADWQVP
ncbi:MULTISPECIES: hypothetical protein [unclassified Bartonella]|nr:MULTISPECIES: hypothetical protein [unclassified Bartonella]